MAITTTFTDSRETNQFSILEGNRTLTRRGKIALPPVSIAVAPQSFGIPTFGSSYSSDPRLKFRGFRVRPLGTGLASEVDLIYSENAGGALPPPERGDVDFLEWTRRTEIQLIDLPYVVTARRDVAGSPSSTTIYYWEPAARRVENVVSVITLQLTVQATSNGISNLAAIQAQTNKIHQINGAKYLFQGGGVSKYSTDRYAFDYAWLVDSGTPAMPKPSSGNLTAGGLRFPERPDNPQTALAPLLLDENPDTPGAIRDPYHVLQYYPNNGTPATVGSVVAKPIGTVAHLLNPNYAEDLTGWQNLPGIGVIP